eukprot:TRINITY_DN2117_c0_g1_i9.p1 TRINITY_DN2117_c0_g1~~TRINITY_DN2117_c0_g1_i9.p1  ORF type:complete len:879 (-),score=226.55 TRINITY_DN2117_c0_g1_i9:209-2845(-)
MEKRKRQKLVGNTPSKEVTKRQNQQRNENPKRVGHLIWGDAHLLMKDHYFSQKLIEQDNNMNQILDYVLEIYGFKEQDTRTEQAERIELRGAAGKPLKSTDKVSKLKEIIDKCSKLISDIETVDEPILTFQSSITGWNIRNNLGLVPFASHRQVRWNNFLEFQREYTKQLDSLMNVYHPSIVSYIETYSPAKLHDVKYIFEHMERIYQLSKKILEKMESHNNHFPVLFGIGKAFLKLENELEVYNQYLGESSQIMETLNALLSDLGLRDYINESCSYHPGIRSIHELLTLPKQAIVRYQDALGGMAHDLAVAVGWVDTQEIHQRQREKEERRINEQKLAAAAAAASMAHTVPVNDAHKRYAKDDGDLDSKPVAAPGRRLPRSSVSGRPDYLIKQFESLISPRAPGKDGKEPISALDSKKKAKNPLFRSHTSSVEDFTNTKKQALKNREKKVQDELMEEDEEEDSITNRQRKNSSSNTSGTNLSLTPNNSSNSIGSASTSASASTSTSVSNSTTSSSSSTLETPMKKQKKIPSTPSKTEDNASVSLQTLPSQSTSGLKNKFKESKGESPKREKSRKDDKTTIKKKSDQQPKSENKDIIPPPLPSNPSPSSAPSSPSQSFLSPPSIHYHSNNEAEKSDLTESLVESGILTSSDGGKKPVPAVIDQSVTDEMKSLWMAYKSMKKRVDYVNSLMTGTTILNLFKDQLDKYKQMLPKGPSRFIQEGEMGVQLVSVKPDKVGKFQKRRYYLFNNLLLTTEVIGLTSVGSFTLNAAVAKKMFVRGAWHLKYLKICREPMPDVDDYITFQIQLPDDKLGEHIIFEIKSDDGFYRCLKEYIEKSVTKVFEVDLMALARRPDSIEGIPLIVRHTTSWLRGNNHNHQPK